MKNPNIIQPEDLRISKIISSNSARVQEALRVIEEFSRIHNSKLSKIASEIRYEIYTLEIEILNFNTRKRAQSIISKNNLYSITDPRENLLEIIEKISVSYTHLTLPTILLV